MIKLSRAAADALTTWTRAFPLPRTYIAVDTETTGLNVDLDRIVHLGWCVIEDTRAVRSEGVVFDWTQLLTADQTEQLAHSLDRTRQSMTARGNQYIWNIDQLRARGVHPVEAVARFVKSWNKRPMVAHYGWGYDYLMLGRLLHAFDVEFAPPHTDLMDTCLMARAVLAPLESFPKEAYRNYVERLKNTRCAKHTLRDCVTLFDLHAYGVDPKHGHDAEYDAWVCHLLLERFRELSIPAEPTTPADRLLARAVECARTILSSELEARRLIVAQLKQNDPALYRLVLTTMNNMAAATAAGGAP